MGGAVSFLAWKKRSSLFSGVIFVAPMCKISDALKPPAWVISLLSRLTGPIGSNGFLGYLPITPTRVDLDSLCNKDVIMKDLCKSTPFLDDRNPRLTTARELLHAASSISSELDAFDAPFLVQHGMADKVTDPKLSQALYDEAKSKDKTIKLYDGMYHALTADVPSETTLVLNDAIQWVLKRV
jgi:caffeoylshikimate esterase